MTDFIPPKVEYNVIIKPDKIIPYKLLIFKIYSKILPAIFNCTAITPITHTKPDMLVTILTFCPYISFIASAIESFPKNSPIRGIKK